VTSKALSSLLFVALAASACSNLQPIGGEICGNRVVEPDAGEDCDGGEQCGTLADGAAACRFTCAAEQACPSGYGCGADGICRQHSGLFELALESDEITLHAQAADIDGDGRLDLFRTSSDAAVAEFFSSDLRTEVTTTLTRLPNDVAPLVTQLTFDEAGEPDGRADVILNAESASTFGSGLAVYRAQADRSLAPTAYSTIGLGGVEALGVAVNAITPFSAEEILGFVQTPVGAQLVGLGSSSLQPHPLPVNDVPVDPRDITGTATGDLVTFGPPCDELVWTAAEAEPYELYVFSPCEPNVDSMSAEWTDNPASVQVVTLPEPLFIPIVEEFLPASYQSNVFVADMDNDGDEDIVVLLESGDLKPVWWIENPSSPDVNPPPPEDDDWENAPIHQLTRVSLYEPEGDAPGVDVWLSACESLTEPGGYGDLLAVADLNEDGAVDFISDDAIWVSRAAVGGGADEKTYLLVDSCLDWGNAVVADFDRNRTLDIAATRRFRTGVDLALSSGDGAFTRNRISTQREVYHLSAGDFDGDFVTDLALMEVEDPLLDELGPEEFLEPTDTLFVAFGAASGGFEEPQSLGTLRASQGLVSGRFEGGDATDDMLVVARNAKSELAIGLFTGNGARQIVSPFLLLEGMVPATKTTEVLQMTAGHFFSDAPRNALAILTRTNEPNADPRLWIVEADFEAELLADQQLSTLAPECANCIAVGMDLDGDAKDELVVLGRERGKVFQSESSGPAFFGDSVDIEGVDGMCFYALDTVERRTLGTALGDVDADGDLDLGVLGRDCDTEVEEAVIFYNDGSGTLSMSRTTRVTLDGGAGSSIRSLGFINVDTDDALELVVSALTAQNYAVFDEGTNNVFDISPEETSLSFDDGTPLALADDDILFPAELMVPGDFSGDGVADLVVTTFDGYAVLKGVAVR
jgi:hypothetical protein